jgi:large subunit ribosomal protein L13
MARIIIDAEGAIYGRLCSYAAKKALEGNEIIIVNSEKSVITGNKKNIIENYQAAKRRGGHSLKGPKISRLTSRLLKRGIRGMLPNFRNGIGREAFMKIKCYDGFPEEFGKEKCIKLKKPIQNKYIELKELSTKI